MHSPLGADAIPVWLFAFLLNEAKTSIARKKGI